MLKKLCSALLVITLIAGMFTAINVSAYNDLSTDDQETAAGLVTALGIMSAEDADNFGSRTIVKRGQFALYAARFMNYQVLPAASSSRGSFNDVDLSTEQGAAIQLLADMGIIPTDSREFNPNADLSYSEAVRIILNCLNYGVVAEMSGGYPSGYLAVASQNDLDDNVSGIGASSLTKADVATILYNALFVYPMENLNGDYSKSSNTILENIYKVTEITGIVTGYGRTALNGQSIADGNVAIDGQVYNCITSDIRNYIGYNVKAYYSETSSGDVVIVAFTALPRKNTVTKFDADDVSSVTNSLIRYYQSSSSSRAVRIASNASVIYNNRYQGTSSNLANLINGVADGDITCIDNDGSGEANVVIINSYKHLLLERVDKRGYRMYLRNGSGSTKSESDLSYLPDVVTTDPEDVYLSVYIGNELVDFDAIQAGDAITMKESLDGEEVELYISRNVITGTITAISDEIIEIGSNSYEISPFVDRQYTAGTAGTFAITTNGKLLGIVETTQNANNSYAYVLKSYVETNAKEAYLKIFTSGGEIISARCANNIQINGTRVKYQEVAELVSAGELITYDLNSDGEFLRVQRPYDASSRYISFDNDGNLSLYVNDTDFVKDWNKSSVRHTDGIMGMTFITGDTTIFAMPRFDEGDTSEYRILRASDLENRTYSDVTAYDIDRQGRAGALLIVEDTSDSVSMSSSLFFVAEVKNAMNADGEKIVRIEGFEKGEAVTLDFDETSKSVTYEDGWMNYSGNETFDLGYESLRPGDAIQYIIGRDGMVSAYRLVYNNRQTAFDSSGRFIESNASNYYEDWSGTGAVTKLDFSDNLYIAYGDVQMRYMDYMVVLGLSQQDRLKYASSQSPVSIMDYYRPINLLKNAYVYVYDVNSSRSGTVVTVGDMEDIQRGDVCFVRSKKMGELNEILVYKY